MPSQPEGTIERVFKKYTVKTRKSKADEMKAKINSSFRNGVWGAIEGANGISFLAEKYSTLDTSSPTNRATSEKKRDLEKAFGGQLQITAANVSELEEVKRTVEEVQKGIEDNLAFIKTEKNVFTRNYLAYPKTDTYQTVDKSIKNTTETLSSMSTYLKGVEQSVAKRIKTIEDFEAQALKDVSTGTNDDGKGHILFVNVGSGDCTMVTTPEGVKIMIDCGSDSKLDALVYPGYSPNQFTDIDRHDKVNKVIYDAINGTAFLNNEKEIGLLILSHPDADHHNLLPQLKIFDDVDLIYFGGNVKNFYAIPDARGKTFEDAHKVEHDFDVLGSNDDPSFKLDTVKYIGELMGGKDTNRVRKVTLKSNAVKVGGKVAYSKQVKDKNLTATAGSKGKTGEEYIGSNGEIVLYYEDHFTISVLAGNVDGAWKGNSFENDETKIKPQGEDRIKSNPTNQGSLVILIECFGKKVMIMGDATAVTEKFMLNYFNEKDILKDVDIFRIGHHGSPTSSLKEFINKVAPTTISVASAPGQFTEGHGLPKKIIMELHDTYFTGKNMRGKEEYITEHYGIWGHEKDGSKAATVIVPNIKTPLYSTGSFGSVECTIDTDGSITYQRKISKPASI